MTFGRFLAVTVGVCIAGAASARPVLQPEVKEYKALPGGFDAAGLPVYHQDQRQCAIAAGETRSAGKASVWDGKSAAARGVYIAVIGSEGGRRLAEEFSLQVPEREQSYAVAAKDSRVAIVGRDPFGALYGAVTYGQMSVDGRCENAVVRDWPDYIYRGGMSLGRSLYYLGNGDRNRMEGMKAGLDMMLRMKLNVMHDYFWIREGASEKSYAYWRELTRYAEDRGIYPDENRFMCVYNRRNRPEWLKKFSDWPCVKTHLPYDDYYYCWADDGATERAALRYAEHLGKLGFRRAHIDIHPVDCGSWQDPESWSRRCAKCRARWKDGERWKASINQFNIWSKVLNARFPDSILYPAVYPYSFLQLMTPESRRTPKWKESMPEYWSKVDAGLNDKTLGFCSWIYTKDLLKEIRQLMPKRAFTVSEPYPSSAGLFSTFHRKIGSAFEPDIPNRISLRGSDSKPKWESVALFAEYAWNVDAPGAEPYDGSTFYDPLVDHTGPADVMAAHLHRICFAYWGKDLAPYMEEVMSSGLMPGYIEDPGHFIRYWNSIRRDPLYDPTVTKKTDLVNKAEPIVDSPAMMGGQVEAAERCLKALKAAEAHLGGIDRFKRKYFMKLRKLVPLCLAAARARHTVRLANDAVAKGDNPGAVRILEEGRVRMEADYAAAEANLKALAGEPASFETWRPRLPWKTDKTWAVKLFDRAVASAKVMLQPRKTGKKVKIGIIGSEGKCKGIKEFFDSFVNTEAAVASGLDLAELDKYDCVFVRSEAYEKDVFFNNLRAYAERGGGGVWLEGYVCGHRRFDTRTPFPEVVETSPERVDNFARRMKLADGRETETMYIDYFTLKPGAQGEVRAFSVDGKPIAVRGACGLGKVFFTGMFSVASVGGTYSSQPLKLFGGSAELAKEAVEYFTGVRLIEKKLLGAPASDGLR